MLQGFVINQITYWHEVYTHTERLKTLSIKCLQTILSPKLDDFIVSIKVSGTPRIS